MAFKIGFSVSEEKEKMTAPEPPDVSEEREPRRSVVRVQFPQRNVDARPRITTGSTCTAAIWCT